MNNKRLELYVGWTCNQKCTYCCEFPNMEQSWDKKVSKADILKNLIKYKKKGYNHVTYLGGEPFIQPVFLDALKLAQKLNYKILVTTNSTTLHIDEQAKKFLPYIDELILSVEAIEKDLQQKISRTNVYVDWEKVFNNIDKYWNGTYFKANIVITKDNLSELTNIVKYIVGKGIKNIAITYPDIVGDYYSKNHILEKIAPKYSECIEQLIDIYDLSIKNDFTIKIVDFPFCIFPINIRDELIKLTDDYDYQTRLKITNKGEELNRNNLENIDAMPRDRQRIFKCNSCTYKGICWGPVWKYGGLYGLKEIKAVN